MTGPLYDLECAAEHADASAAPPPSEHPVGAYAPGGRWERVLRALDTRGPLKASQIFAATRSAGLKIQTHSGKAERAKVWRALVGLQDLGFVHVGDGARFVLTPRGRAVLHDGEAV